MRERLLAAEQVVGFVWREGALHVLDQRRLPGEQVWHACHSVSAVAAMSPKPMMASRVRSS